MGTALNVFRSAYSWLGLAVLAAVLAIFFGFGTVKGNSTVKPLVYLVPADFVGPVFVFFGQQDGVDVMPDPLGNAVMVPRNGVVKLKGSVDELISSGGTARNLYWVSLSKDGQRKVLWIVNALSKDEDGDWIYSYFDESGKPHVAKGPSAGSYFEHIPESRRNDRMVMSNDGCKHQRFAPPDAPDSQIPDCAKFLIASPYEYRGMPRWVWRETNHEYESIQAFEVEATERALKIESVYKAKSIPAVGARK